MTLVAFGMVFTPARVSVPAVSVESDPFTVEVYPSTVPDDDVLLRIGLSGSANNLGNSPTLDVDSDFAISPAPLITAVGLNDVVVIHAGGSRSSSFTMFLNIGAASGTVKLTPLCAGVEFIPPSVYVQPDELISGSLRARANASAPLGVADVHVLISGDASNLDEEKRVRISTNGLLIYAADPVSSITFSSGGRVAMNAGSVIENVRLATNVAAANGYIRLTPTATGLTFLPSFVDISADLAVTEAFRIAAAAAAPEGIINVSVIISGTATNIAEEILTSHP